MKFERLRIIVPLAVLAALTVGLVVNSGTGTLSAFGWRDISLLCPLGALTSMLAAKTVFPRAVFALLAVVVIILLSGRAFCTWACPAPLVARLRNAFSRKPRPLAELRALQEGGQAEGDDGAAGKRPAALTDEERELLRGGTEAGCRACHERFPRVDSRHLVLGGAVLSAAVFGFPVFCLICPVGLTFGSILLVIALFGYGDVTWSVVLVPLLLLAEMVLFRKWCAKICPMGAFLSLVGKANATFRPQIDSKKCLETTRGATCGACTKACEQGVNLRDGELGAARSECTRCLACVEACPAGAVHVKPIAKAPARKPAAMAAAEGGGDASR